MSHMFCKLRWWELLPNRHSNESLFALCAISGVEHGDEKVFASIRNVIKHVAIKMQMSSVYQSVPNLQTSVM